MPEETNARRTQKVLPLFRILKRRGLIEGLRMVVHGRSRADDYRTRWRKDTALLFCGLEHQAKFSNQRRCIAHQGVRTSRAGQLDGPPRSPVRMRYLQLSTFDDGPIACSNLQDETV